MKAIQVTQYVNGPLDLFATQLPTPSSHPTKYLIKIRAAGAHFFDLLQIRGKYQNQPPLPWASGSEFSGIVIATPTTSKETGSYLASSVDGTINANTQHKFKVGDCVLGSGQGAFATHIMAPESSLVLIPAGWSFVDAAGLYVTAPTSDSALVMRAKLQKGEWVLVHAGAGGVGLEAVQIAKALGATVIATAGSERKRQVCLEYGADYVVDYRDKVWPQKVIALCEQHWTGNWKKGVDVIYDPVLSLDGMIDPSIKCIAWNRRLLVTGFAGSDIEKVALNRVLLKNISIVDLNWGAHAIYEKEMSAKIWEGIFHIMDKGQTRGITFTDQTFRGLDNVLEALKALGDRNLGEGRGGDRGE